MFCFCHLFNNPVPAMQLLSAKRPGSGLLPSHRRFASLSVHVDVTESEKEKMRSERERQDRNLASTVVRVTDV